MIGISIRESIKIFGATLKQLMFPIITIAAVVGYAFIANYAGMSITMAGALASTGVLFPFFSPILGWLGVFLTGSDTSANALFGKMNPMITSVKAVIHSGLLLTIIFGALVSF